MNILGHLGVGDGYRYLFSIIRSQIGKFLLMVICIICGAFTNMLSIGSIIPLVSSFTQDSDVEKQLPSYIKWIFSVVDLKIDLMNTAVVFFVLVIIAAIFEYFRKVILEKLLIDISVELQTNLFSIFLKTNWSYLLSTNNNQIQNALLEQISKIGKSIKIISGFFAAVLNIAFYLYLIISISGFTTFALVVLFLMIPCVVLLFVIRVSKRLGKSMVEISSHMHQIILDSLSGLKFIKASALSNGFLKNFHDKVFRFGQAQLKSIVIRQFIVFLEEPAKMVGVLGVILLLRHLNPELGLASMVALGLLLQRCYMLVSANVATMQELATCISAAELCGKITWDSASNFEKTGSINFGVLENSVLFENVSFSYPSGVKVLDECTFEFALGKTTALLGASGSGKTTIVDLLLGLNKITMGKILVNGFSIDELNLDNFRLKIGYVPQDSYIINGTIRHNLLLGNDVKSEQDIWRALDQAHAREFIEKSEAGLETLVGDGGLRLSGGQKQRLALARALLREPQILILDEATSALDVNAEKIVQQAIEELGHCMTIIVIAHRLNTVKNADIFLEVNGGKVINTDYDTFVNKIQGININHGE